MSLFHGRQILFCKFFILTQSERHICNSPSVQTHSVFACLNMYNVHTCLISGHCARESLKCSHSLLWLSLSCLLWLTDDALKSETVTLMVCLRQSVHHTVYALIMLNTANYWCMLKYLVMRNHINFLPKCIFVNFCHTNKQTRQIYT